MGNKKKFKKYICKHCKTESEQIGVVQSELKYYSLNIETNQWKDFHGDDDVKDQKFFCINCNNEVNDIFL